MIDGISKLINDTQDFLPRIPELLVTLVAGYIIIALLIAGLTRGLRLFHLPKALIEILKSLTLVVLWIVLVSHLLRLLGLSQVAVTLSGSLLVIGLAIANGAQAMVSDVISGLFLAKDPDFNIGYTIKVGETEGVIEAIDIRKTRVRGKDDTLFVLPNAQIDKEHWQVVNRGAKQKDEMAAKGIQKG